MSTERELRAQALASLPGTRIQKRDLLRQFGTRAHRRCVFGTWRRRRQPSSSLRVRLIADALLEAE